MLYQGANTEEKFLELLRDHSQGQSGLRTALMIHLSKLAPKNRQPYHIRMALNSLKDHLERIDGKAFLFHNSDIMLVARHTRTERIEDIERKIRYFFSNDPLLQDQRGDKTNGFSSLYDLTLDTREVAGIIEQLLAEKVNKYNQKIDRGGNDRADHLTPDRLARLAKSLAPSDISTFIRRQPICLVEKDKTPTPIFHELYVRIADLQRVTFPDVELTGNRWLFSYLTRVLDERILWLVTKFPEEFVIGPMSLNLNIRTLLSQKFIAFSNNLDSSMRTKMRFEIQFIDISANLDAYRFARSFLKACDYTVILDGASHLNLPEIACAGFGVDYIKMVWNPRIIDTLPEREKEALEKAVQTIGPEKIIFSRCSTNEEIDTGQKMDISLYQGRFVDRLVNPNSRRLN